MTLLACLLLVFTAGCIGVLPTDQAETDSAGGTDESTESISSRPRATTPPYEAIPSGDTVAETHQERIQEAGSATITVTRNVTGTYPNRTITDRVNRTGKIDYTTSPPRQHVVDDDGKERWIGAEQNLTRRSGNGYTRTASSFGAVDGIDGDAFDMFDFAGPEPLDRADESHSYYRYRANGTDSLADDVRSELENVTIEHASGSLVVRGDGLVVSYDIAIEGTGDDLAYDQRRSIRYADVGTTEVTRPDWYDVALSETDPLPTETITETGTVPGINATLEVTGEAIDIADEYSSKPTMDERGTYAADELELAQVSCLVYVYLPDDFESAELTVGYEEEHVPGDEAGLEFLRYDQYNGTYTTVGEVDTANDTATASIGDDGFYFVRHEPTYDRVFVSGEEPSETAPPPTCD